MFAKLGQTLDIVLEMAKRHSSTRRRVRSKTNNGIRVKQQPHYERRRKRRKKKITNVNVCNVNRYKYYRNFFCNLIFIILSKEIYYDNPYRIQARYNVPILD